MYTGDTFTIRKRCERTSIKHRHERHADARDLLQAPGEPHVNKSLTLSSNKNVGQREALK